MVEYSNYAASQLKILIMKYNGFHTKNEYGISAFWYWYYQVRNYMRTLDTICEEDCQYSKFKGTIYLLSPILIC